MMPIKVMFKSGGGARVQLFSISAVDQVMDPANASAGFEFANTGAETEVGNFAGAGYNWKLTGAVADYDIMVSLTSGTFTSGSATGSWLNLATTRTWTNVRAGIGLKSTQGTVQIRDASTLAVLAGPVSFEVSAEVDG